MVLDFWAELKISKLIFFDKVIRQNVNIKSIIHAALPPGTVSPFLEE